MSAVLRKRGSKCRTCVDCGLVESVRQDNTALRCKPCAVKRSAWVRADADGYSSCRPPVKVAKPENRMTLSCSGCAGVFTRFVSGVKNPERSYCSAACKVASRSVARTCKCCGAGFTTQVGRLSGKTNSSANFCSRPCYDKWLCNTERTKSRGSRWAAISKGVIAAAPFCACCGRASGRLETHHILPYRLSKDNSASNLVPLCRSCHKKIEVATVELENNGVTPATIGWFMRVWLRYRQVSTAHILRKVSNDRHRIAA